MSNELRERNKIKRSSPEADNMTRLVEIEDSSFSLLDIFRTITLFIIMSSVISYFITGESFVWNIQSHVWKRPVTLLRIWLVFNLFLKKNTLELSLESKLMLSLGRTKTVH